MISCTGLLSRRRLSPFIAIEPYALKKNNVEISVPEVVQPPPLLWKDVAGEPILLPSLGGSGHYYWGGKDIVVLLPSERWQ